MIYKDIEINCTQNELDAYIESLNCSSELHNFADAYNGSAVENPTSSTDAKYYILTVGDIVTVQAHVPFIAGYEPVTTENAAEVINLHLQQLVDSLVYAKFAEVQE